MSDEKLNDGKVDDGDDSESVIGRLELRIEKQDKIVDGLKKDLVEKDSEVNKLKSDLFKATQAQTKMGVTVGELRKQKQKLNDKINMIQTKLKPALKSALNDLEKW
ncbi:unnamed protein product [marine sediment metagenome]|uniref:Uncharacterized protein n=1 Tax=marine sediment metagenome TaxID=412755 RepID=X0Y2P0_9ZZZZ